MLSYLKFNNVQIKLQYYDDPAKIIFFCISRNLLGIGVGAS